MNREEKRRAKDAAGKIIIEEINSHLDDSRSPVSGGQFKRAKKDGGRSILFEFGDMRDSIEFKRRRGDDIEVGIFKNSETPKAFNHTTGDTLPKREFIPREGQDFKGRIMRRVGEAIDQIRENAPSPERRTLGDIFAEIELTIDVEVTSGEN